MEMHRVPLGAEFQIHQIEIPKLGSKWILHTSSEEKCKLNCELLDVGPGLGDGAMRKFIFQSIAHGYSEIHLIHQGADGSVIETASYGVTSE